MPKKKKNDQRTVRVVFYITPGEAKKAKNYFKVGCETLNTYAKDAFFDQVLRHTHGYFSQNFY